GDRCARTQREQGRVKRCICPGPRLEAVVEVDDTLVEWQLVEQHCPVGAEILQLALRPAPLLAELQHVADKLGRHMQGRHNERLLDVVDLLYWRQQGWIVN